jgi:hypothetical protein
MDWDSKTPTAVPAYWLKAEYHEAYSLAFRIENALRLFTYLQLKSALQENWTLASLESDDRSPASISSLARQRQAQDKKFGYLGTVSTNPLVYLTTGELFRLMLSKAYWPHFSPYFPAARDVIETRLDELSNIRNSLAHFRPVLPSDVTTLKHTAAQLLSRIESALSSVVSCVHVVPTNLAEDWFSNLAALDASPCKLKFRHSADWAWVAVRMHYPCRVLVDNGVTGSFRKARVAKLEAAQVLNLHPKLRANVVALLEEIKDQSMGGSEPSAVTVLTLVLKHEVLQANWQAVLAELGMLLTTLRAETAQVERDHLAQGQLVHAVDIFGELQSAEVGSSWSHDLSVLASTPKADDPVEYWGNFNPSSADHFISATRRYPWMLIDV